MNRGAQTAGQGAVLIAGAKVYFILASYGVALSLPRLLGSPEAFGLYSTALSGVSILNNVLIASTIQSVSKFTSESSDDRSVLRQALVRQAFLGGGLALTLFLVAPLLSRVLFDAKLVPLLRVASVVVFAYALYATLVGHLNGGHRFGAQAKLDATFTTLRTIGIVGGAAIGLGAIGAMAGFAAAATAIMAWALWVVGTGQRGTPLPLRRWLAFVVPIWTYQLCLNGLMQLDLQILKRTAAELALQSGMDAMAASSTASAYVGVYRGAQTFAFVPYQLSLALAFVVFPLIARATSTGDAVAARRTIRAAFRVTAMLTLSVAAPIAGAADGVLRIAYPETYVAGAGALGVLVMGMVAFSLFVIGATILSSAGKPAWAATIAAATVATLVAVVRLLISRVGLGEQTLQATATGTVISMVAALFLVGVAVFAQFRALISVTTAVRVLVAATIAFFAARWFPHTTPIAAIGALFAGFVSYWLVALFVREIQADDVRAVRHALGRR